ncbi:MAG: transcription antitermination factor NusB [Bacteroidota bacterium]
MTAKPSFNRRFIRLQAVQHLYAFYIGKQANYTGALAQIQAAFIPDVFADSPVDPTQLTQEAQQARDLFNATLATRESSPPDLAQIPSRVQVAVITALTSYKNELAKDMRKLEQGLAHSVAAMNQACVRIWQLLVEWGHLAQKQTEKPRRAQRQSMTTSVCLADSPLLQHLQKDSQLAQLVQQERAGWGAHMPLVESWYYQFVKKDPTIQRHLADLSIPTQEQRLLVFLVEEIIFGQAAIQAFFSEVDLHWATHKRLVKKRVRQGLVPSKKNSEKGPTLETFGAAAQWAEAQRFYTDLIHKVWQQDETLEALMAQHSNNWAIDRIMLLDKTIIKLALCEMCYFPSIPVKVSINEYIDIAKTYSIPKSSQFVNGLLDAIANTMRPGEASKKV